MLFSRDPATSAVRAIMWACLGLALAFPAALAAQPREGSIAAALPAASGEADDGAESDPLSVLAQDVSGPPGESIPLAVTVQRDAEHAASGIYLVGVPKGAHLSDSSHAATAAEDRSIIDVTDWSLADLAITLPPKQAGSYVLMVAAMVPSENGAASRIARSSFTLDVRPKGQARAAPGAPAPPANRPQGPEPARVVVPAPAPMPPPRAVVAPASAAPAAQVFVPQAPAVRPIEPPPAPVTEAPVDRRPDPAANAALQRPSALPPPPALPETNPSRPLVERAEELIRQGDISGARLVLERAMSQGDARATFLLGQTWDPRSLKAWKVQGLRPDPERARALYAKAAQEGLPEARAFAEAMR